MHVVLHSHSSGKAELRVLYPWKITQPPPKYLSLPSVAATTTSLSASELSEIFDSTNRIQRTYYIRKSGEDNEVL